MNQESKKEREIMMVMRKLLTTIVREVTPEHKSLRHPLSDHTIQDIRGCLGLITACEKELADNDGKTAQERPYFTDDPPETKIVPISKIGKVKQESEA
ncbi:MAG: segregation and condensation protein A [Candidatus Thiodiazotropha sp. (ex Lucinoma aequizonata)]|nr:segregation and condensation protein A [Candidatus Thiodiazotropha sp. (ex Lucinoma aequizonata)]MCU7887885.1 segregation and condensation protein A [Candidatus Thiodiazotropha sp. (ex Lucinoma aequizonata)]MCU7895053.1 segregation and condensation protein A [Candidatus Thiodiazotropha sp. (ex Lucinoma aequizonata)]MCU7897250.1 segregation and condensation protein A [Candidatus Thiodiazotropha sp. (ex Lucinoma aequizonata)]MCU7904005.1 segregation and condensation protein A [Candidatus Thiod